MNQRRLVAVGIVLLIAGIGTHVARLTVPPSELARTGVRTLGQVLFKDSRPGPDGTFTYSVTFVFADATQRNYQVTRLVPDKAIWDELKTGAEVRVLYMPADPEQASIAGAEGLARPRDAAYAFLAWSAMVAGLVLLGMAFRRASAAAAPAEQTSPDQTTAKKHPKIMRGGRD